MEHDCQGGTHPRGSKQQTAIPYVVYHAGVQRLAHVRSDDSSFAIESSARYWYASIVLCSSRVRHKRLPPVLLYQDDIDNKLSSSSSAMVASPGGAHSGIANPDHSRKPIVVILAVPVTLQPL